MWTDICVILNSLQSYTSCEEEFFVLFPFNTITGTLKYFCLNRQRLIKYVLWKREWRSLWLDRSALLKKGRIEKCRIAIDRSKSKQRNTTIFQKKKFRWKMRNVPVKTRMALSESWCFLGCYEYAIVSIKWTGSSENSRGTCWCLSSRLGI